MTFSFGTDVTSGSNKRERICVCEREREKRVVERKVCVSEREGESVRECVCLSLIEREREREREREWGEKERVCVRESELRLCRSFSCPFPICSNVVIVRHCGSQVSSVTRLCDLAPIGRQFKLTGSFWNFRSAQFNGLQIGRSLKIPFFVII